MTSAGELVGTWRLLSAVMEDVETREQTHTWGESPKGWLIATAAGRWMVIQTAEQRQAGNDEAARAAAFRSMLANSGRYRIDGDKIIIDVDISWDESWLGGQQIRLFRIDGNTLHIEALPQPYANFGGKVMRGILRWQRAS